MSHPLLQSRPLSHLLLALGSAACTEPPASPAPEAEEQGSDGVDGLGGDTLLEMYGGGSMSMRFLGAEGQVLEEISVSGVEAELLPWTGDALAVSVLDPNAPTTTTPETEIDSLLDEAAWMRYFLEEYFEVMGYAEPFAELCDYWEGCGKVGLAFTFRATNRGAEDPSTLSYELSFATVVLGLGRCSVNLHTDPPGLASAPPVVGRENFLSGSAWVTTPSSVPDGWCNNSDYYQQSLAWIEDRWPGLSGIEASWAFDPEVAWVAEDPFGTPE